jgi:hypothetical protein
MIEFKTFCENKQLNDIAKKAGVDIDGIDMTQLKMGMEVEKEHDKDKDTDVVPGHEKATVMKIAVAHLREIPDYYTRLNKMEKKAK